MPRRRPDPKPKPAAGRRAPAAPPAAAETADVTRWMRTLEHQVRMLERERRKFVALVEHSGARVFVAGPDGAVLWTNSTLAVHPPRDADGTWIGRRCRDVCAAASGDGRGCEECAVARAVERNENVFQEVRWEHPDGERMHFMSALPIHGPAGSPEEVLVTLQDLSDLDSLRQSESRQQLLLAESRRVAAELRRTKDNLTRVLGKVPVVLFAVDRQGTFTLSEGRGLERLGLRPGQVVGQSVFELYKEFPHIVAAIRRSLAGEELTDIVELGGLAYESHYAPIRDESGEVTGTIGVAVDCTERRRLERQLLQGSRMEAMGQLASGVAHDFNNLLAAILGHTELMLARLEQRHPLWQHAHEVQRAALRGAALTRQLLAFSRRDVTAPRTIDAGAIVAALHGMLHRLIGEDVELVTTAAPEPLGVRAERAPLEQVLLNLAVNSRDAMPEGGRLVIDASSVTLDDAHVRRHPETVPGPHVCITVSDTGHGMSAETLARIFEPFYTTKDAGKGTGLGLSAVYGIVRGWGGHVTVESEPGRGATFRIYLPQVPVEAEAPAPPAAPRGEDGQPQPAPGGSETLLLVEDEATVRDTAAEILRERGYQVIEAVDGADALHVAERFEGPIHLLVSDVVMPNMSGGDLARALASERPGLRVLFVSGYAADEQVREHVRHHAVAFLQKPFSIESLARAVRDALDAPPAERAA